MTTDERAYVATSQGVSVTFRKGQDIRWFIEMAIDKGGTITIEPMGAE